MTDMVDRIADILIEDHVAVLAENKRLREALEEVKPLVLGANLSLSRYPKNQVALNAEERP